VSGKLETPLSRSIVPDLPRAYRGKRAWVTGLMLRARTRAPVWKRGAAGVSRPVGASDEVGTFSGSTIGNFEPREASAFLRRVAKILGPDARLIVGADLAKDQAVLHAAYNDAAGVTARFNLNLLARIKRELDADFDLDAFLHQAFYNPERARIEMHLVSLVRQRVHVAGHTFAFRAGETIHTENSYKFTPGRFAALVRNAGWTRRAMFTDPDSYFSVHALVAK
jgi:L-histidine Nalpha-methyltransferase